MDIRKIDIKRLNPSAYNPRVKLAPSDTEYQMLAKSIDEFGYVDPIIWNEKTGNVVGGHQRLKILVERGMTEIFVSVINLSEDKEKALNLALNKVQGEWDNAGLASLLAEINEMDFDISLTGFDPDEVSKILDTAHFEIGSISDQGDLSTLENKPLKTVICPHCKMEFEM